MADPHPNLAYSTVATAPSPATSGTSLVVAAGEGARFASTPFNAVIWPAGTMPTTANAEIVRVTARATDTLTITRIQEATTARTVVVGDQIAAAITAKSLTDIETDVATRALDTAVVHLAGTETLTGAKTLSADALFGANLSLTGTGLITHRGMTSSGALWEAMRLSTDATASNRVEFYPDSIWFGAGGNPGPGGTDAAIYRNPTGGVLELWAGAVQKVVIGAGTGGRTTVDGRIVGQDALASLTATSAAIANTETRVIGATIPANQMQAGTTYRIKAGGTGTASSATAGSTWRVRIGTTTLTGVIPASLTGTSAIGTAIPFMIEAIVTIRAAGTTGTAIGSIVYNSNAATGNLNTTIAVGQVTATVTVNTTVSNVVELTYISGVSTTTSTYYEGVLELVKA